LLGLLAPQTGTLQSFYVRSPGPYFGDDIISVEQVGDDVRVRAFQVAPTNEHCNTLLVEAAERVVPHTTVQAVAGVNICAMSQEHVERALARARQPGLTAIDYRGSAVTVVANCGGSAKVLEMVDSPSKAFINFDRLHSQSRDVSKLWDLGKRASDELSAVAASDVRERLGTSLVPELISTKYAAAFGDDLAKRLKDYKGPPAERQPRFVKVVERDSLPFTRFVMPQMPQIALSARVFGDVRLRLTIDPNSGVVTAVDVVTPPKPFLTDAAVGAARIWRFDPDKLPREPIEVTVRFGIECPAR
jgi:TonB family protein